MKNQDYLEAFEDFLLEEEKSLATIAGYKADANHFLNFIGKKVIKDIKRNEINAYKDSLRKRGLKVQTINRKLVSVKQFIDFINDRFDLGISVRVKQEKIQKQYSLKDEELMTQDDFEKLMDVIEKAGDIRTKALFQTMAFSGMRISEALQLRVDHVEQKLELITDIKGKGGKYRDIYMNDELLFTLEEYLNNRKTPFASTPTSTDLLFLGERGPITRQAAHHLIKKYAKLAGIASTKAHVHNLRHLFGLNLAAEGMPIEEIAQLMGHTSIETTKIYLTKPQSYFKNKINGLSFIGKKKAN